MSDVSVPFLGYPWNTWYTVYRILGEVLVEREQDIRTRPENIGFYWDGPEVRNCESDDREN